MKANHIIVACALFAGQIAAADTFEKGTWDLELSASYVHQIRFSDDKFYNVTLGGGYYLADNISLSAELQGYYVDQPFDDAIVGGLGVLLRWHLIHFDRFTIFADGGGGVSMADAEVPNFGTHFNFTGKVGPGLSYALDDRTHLLGGVRYFHLSNWNIHGRDQNPSYDGVQFWVGMMWTQ